MSFGAEGTYFGHPAGEDESVTPEEELRELVRQTANYQGDWTNLLQQRLLDPQIRSRFIESKRNNLSEEKRRSFDSFEVGEKPVDVPVDHIEQSINNYPQTIRRVFKQTGYTTTLNYNQTEKTNQPPEALGVSRGFNDHGFVFKDAVYDDRKLSDREKNIVEAHEKAHGVLWRLTNQEKRNILSCFDMQKLVHKKKDKADEVLARMSQLKNYFGMKGVETFTKAHLDYAREHYVKDVVLDNNISNLFDSIQDEDRFIELMNTVAC